MLTNFLKSIAIAASLCGLSTAQRVAFSTHDWQSTGAATVSDSWADVKTPGDGRTYCVGTTEIVGSGSSYSGAPCSHPPAWPVAGPGRKVVVLQISDPNGILHQAYFYGFTPNQPGGGLSSYARAIAVAPGPTPLETRIAVCGDTFDEDLPRSTTDIYTGTNSGQPTGFIALFRGDGVLLWSYHLFGEDTSAATGVTDVVVEHDAPSDLDIVTYCGCSTNGNYNSASGLTTTMEPLAAFQAPVAACTQFAGGDTHNAPP